MERVCGAPPLVYAGRPYKSTRRLTSGLKIHDSGFTSSQWKPWEHRIVGAAWSNVVNMLDVFPAVRPQELHCACLRVPLVSPPPAMRPATPQSPWKVFHESASPTAPDHRAHGVGPCIGTSNMQIFSTYTSYISHHQSHLKPVNNSTGKKTPNVFERGSKDDLWLHKFAHPLMNEPITFTLMLNVSYHTSDPISRAPDWYKIKFRCSSSLFLTFFFLLTLRCSSFEISYSVKKNKKKQDTVTYSRSCRYNYSYVVGTVKATVLHLHF